MTTLDLFKKMRHPQLGRIVTRETFSNLPTAQAVGIIRGKVADFSVSYGRPKLTLKKSKNGGNRHLVAFVETEETPHPPPTLAMVFAEAGIESTASRTDEGMGDLRIFLRYPNAAIHSGWLESEELNLRDQDEIEATIDAVVLALTRLGYVSKTAVDVQVQDSGINQVIVVIKAY